MPYKIKVKPEDFIVKELSPINLKKRGKYAVFILKKKGWNTVDLLKKISKNLKIPFENISYGGKKDRHAITEQVITIKNLQRIISLKEENYSLEFIGFSDEPMNPQLIQGNAFRITVRSIPENTIKDVLNHTEKIKNYGFINYFDDQRFGSFDPKQGFIAEKVLKGHYNGALKIYLTHIYPEDKKPAKERKKLIFENWGKWKECLKVAKTNFEKFAFNHLIEHPKDYLSILRKIPKEEMSLFFSAYQSYLWNETIRNLLYTLFSIENLLFHKGIAGDYVFFNEIDKKNYSYLKTLKIPTASSKAVMPDEITEKIYREILDKEGLQPSMFNLKKIRQSFFKSVDRAVLVMPEFIKYEMEDDELYKGRKKLIIEFLLPRGSYATMLIKRIFAK